MGPVEPPCIDPLVDVPPVDFCPVAWPWDPIYRPTVGVFADGRLIGVLPTVRRPVGEPGQTTRWSCVVDRAAAVRLAPADARVELTCLETDEWLTAPIDPPSGLPDARALIMLSRRQGTPSRLDGFAALLRLPVPEQVSLVFFATVGRPAQDGDRAMIDSVFHRDDGSILELRDRLLTSRDFLKDRLAAVAAPYGHWLCWPGLAEVADNILPAPAVSVPGFWRRPVDVADLPPAAFAAAVARMALGPDADADLGDRWAEDHAAAVAALRSALASRRRAPDDTVRSAVALDFGQALGHMSVGAGGRRTKSSVLIRPRHAGDVLYGPYARLSPGRYSVSFRLMASAAETRPGLLFLEIVAAEIIVAGLAVRVGAVATERITLAFTVPAGLPAMATTGLEYRLRSDGRVRGLVEEVRLLRLSTAEAQGLAAPEVDDWLPLLKVGEAGAEIPGGIAGLADLSGYVFFGPYRALMTGSYSLVVALEATPGSPDGAMAVLLEVVDRNQTAIASDHMCLAEGVSSIVLPFTIRNPLNGAPPGTLEFRLRKEAGSVLLVTHVGVVARSADMPAAVNALAGAG